MNTGLQLLVEHYFGFHPQFAYTPRVLSELRRKISQLPILPPTLLGPLLAGIADHEKEVLAIRGLVGDLRSEFRAEEDSSGGEEGDLSV